MLRGRVAVITGGGRGIGGAAARLFAREGARVVVNDVDGALAAQAARALREAGADASHFGGSVVEDGFAEALMEHTVGTFGAPEVVVNNAGFLWDGVLHKMPDKQWDSVLACHLGAPFRIARAAAPHMRAAAKAEPRDRCIVNVSSTSGLHGNVGQANYAAAKAGIEGLTKTIAKEWGPLGIRCNAVAFGMIDTRMTNAFAADGAVEVAGERVEQGLPKHVAAAWEDPTMLGLTVPLCRKGTAEEAAAGILFLASPLATYVTGHTLEVTGGMGI